MTSPPVGKLAKTYSPTEAGSNTFEDDMCIGPGGEKSETLTFDEESDSSKGCKDDADPWRTCIWRTTSVDKCDRMVKAKPYVGEDETLISGTMTVTLSQSRQSTSCKNIIQLEKLLLTYLADNIGNDDRFQIACVYTLSNAREGKELSTGKSVESTALEYRLTFIEQSKTSNRIFKGKRRYTSLFQRRETGSGRALAKCSGIDKAMCCSQFAINRELGEYCSSVGCGPKYCGNGRRKRKRKPGRDERRASESFEDDVYKFKVFENSGAKGRPKPIPEPFIGEVKNVNPCIFYGELTGEDWNDSVRTYSEFKPQASRSLLDVGDVKSVALCNCNRYSVDTFDEPALSCSEYNGNDCIENEDMVSSKIPDDRMSPFKAPEEVLVFDVIDDATITVPTDIDVESVTLWRHEQQDQENSVKSFTCGMLTYVILFASLALFC